MIPIFLGLTIANLALLGLTFGLGLFATDGGRPSGWYEYHLLLGIGAGLMAVLTHLAIYTYFMATTRWLGAAADKAGLALDRFVVPAARRKGRAFAVVMMTIVATMLTMFAGAGADPTRGALWPGEVHLALAGGLIVVHLGAAVAEYRLIGGQGALMDEALVLTNRQVGTGVQSSAAGAH